MNVLQILSQTQRQRVSDGHQASILPLQGSYSQLLIVILPQLGDFDSLEYAWWLNKAAKIMESQQIALRAIGIGDRSSGLKFCEYTKFPSENLFVEPRAELHRQLGLYQGLSLKMPWFSPQQNAWLNLMFMCAGICSPGTLAEVFRGYRGDRSAPQLIDDDEIIHSSPLPPLKGSFFKWAGGKSFQRPFELATLRLRNMSEVLSNWKTYVPDASYLTVRGATFLFNNQGTLVYEHRDRGILGFAENMSNPLSFLKIKQSDYQSSHT